MTTAKPRSSFLPILLLIVGVVICAGAVLLFKPMVECEVCLGAQNVTFHEYTIVQLENGLSRPFRGAGEPFDPGDVFWRAVLGADILAQSCLDLSRLGPFGEEENTLSVV